MVSLWAGNVLQCVHSWYCALTPKTKGSSTMGNRSASPCVSWHVSMPTGGITPAPKKSCSMHGSDFLPTLSMPMSGSRVSSPWLFSELSLLVSGGTPSERLTTCGSSMTLKVVYTWLSCYESEEKYQRAWSCYTPWKKKVLKTRSWRQTSCAGMWIRKVIEAPLHHMLANVWWRSLARIVEPGGVKRQIQKEKQVLKKIKLSTKKYLIVDGFYSYYFFFFIQDNNPIEIHFFEFSDCFSIWCICTQCVVCAWLGDALLFSGITGTRFPVLLQCLVIWGLGDFLLCVWHTHTMLAKQCQRAVWFVSEFCCWWWKYRWPQTTTRPPCPTWPSVWPTPPPTISTTWPPSPPSTWLLYRSGLHRLIVSTNTAEINAVLNSIKRNSRGVPSCHVAHNVLHMNCTQLHPGHLSVHVGNSSQHSEEIVKILNCTFQCNHCYYYPFSCLMWGLWQPLWPSGKVLALRGGDTGIKALFALSADLQIRRKCDVMLKQIKLNILLSLFFVFCVPSYICGFHHSWWNFCVHDGFLIQP